MRAPPGDYVALPQTVYSNFDHTFDEGVPEKLRNGKFTAGHASSACYGHVWFEGGKWYEKVMCHGTHTDTFVADDLKELIDKVNVEYGRR